MVVITLMYYETYIFSGYLDVVRVTGDHGAPRKPWTQLIWPLRPDFVDCVVSTYLLLRRGVSPPCKGDAVVQEGATNTS
jgi:hypothetical protein